MRCSKFSFPLFLLQIYEQTRDEHFALVIVDYGSLDMDIAAEANRSTFKRWVGYWAEPESWVWFGRIRDLDHVDSYIRRGIQREGSTCVRMYVVWPDLLKIPPVSNPVVLSFIFKKILVTSNYLVCVVVVVCLFVCFSLLLVLGSTCCR